VREQCGTVREQSGLARQVLPFVLVHYEQTVRVQSGYSPIIRGHEGGCLEISITLLPGEPGKANRRRLTSV
jgi:predicted ATP-dependent serine protease